MEQDFMKQVYGINYLSNFTLLHMAVTEKNVEKIRSLLNNGADVNVQDSRGNSPLHCAVTGQEITIIELLLKSGANPNVQNTHGFTPFYSSFKFNNNTVISMLLSYGAKLNIKTKFNHNALHLSAMHSREISMFQHLFEKGMVEQSFEIEDYLSLLHFIFNSNIANDRILQILQLFLHYNINISKNIESSQILLLKAVKRKDAGIVEVFLRLGADPDGAEQSQPLLLAIKNGDLSIIECLINYGAKLYVKNSEHQGVLHVTIRNVVDKTLRYAIFKLLVEKGANVNEVDYVGTTVLQLAVIHQDSMIIHYLLELGINVNVPNYRQESPLYIAITHGLHKWVRVLLVNHADIHHRDCDGRSLLYLAVRKGHRDIIQLLLKHGLSILNETNIIGTAVANKDKEMVVFLLKSGASIDNEKNLLSIAAANGDHEMVSLLHFLNKGITVQDIVSKGTYFLETAVKSKNKLMLTFFVANGANVDNVKTLLPIAVENGDHEMAAFLLENGVDVNDYDFDGRHLLLEAITKDNSDVVKVLLNNGIKFNHSLALATAIENTSESAFQALRSVDNYNATDDFKQLNRRRLNIIERLLEQGCSVNIEYLGVLPLKRAPDFSQSENSNGLKTIYWNVFLTLIKHVALLMYQNSFVHIDNVNIIKSAPGILEYYSKCREQLGLMRSTKIIDNCDTTYLDILTKRNNALAAPLSKVEVCRRLESDDLEEMFSIYFDKLKIRYEYGLRRLNNSYKFHMVLNKIFANSLPRNAITKLSKFYTDEEFFVCLKN